VTRSLCPRDDKRGLRDVFLTTLIHGRLLVLGVHHLWRSASVDSWIPCRTTDCVLDYKKGCFLSSCRQMCTAFGSGTSMVSVSVAELTDCFFLPFLNVREWFNLAGERL
jgi:hypothetical protein